MICNRRIHFIDINLFPMSSGVKERASEQMSLAARASQASSAEQANEWAVRANEQTEYQMTQHFTRADFIVILPYVRYLCACVFLYLSTGRVFLFCHFSLISLSPILSTYPALLSLITRVSSFKDMIYCLWVFYFTILKINFCLFLWDYQPGNR